MRKTSIVAIANQKGGVGKTATSVNLAASFAHTGKRTLLIDLDYQANATAYLGLKKIAKEKKKVASEGLKSAISLSECILETDIKGLDLVAGDMALSKLSRELALDPGSSLILKQWLSDQHIENYDVVLIDTHPSLDLLFQMAMTAAHYYLVPMFAEADPFDGLQYMFDEVHAIKARLNPQLYFLGLLITKFDKTNSTHRKFYDLLEAFCSENKMNLRGTIPDSKAVASSSSQQKPLLLHMPSLPVTKSFIEQARMIAPDLKGARMGRKQGTPKISETPETISKIFETEEATVLDL